MADQRLISSEGVVVENLPNTQFRIRLTEGDLAEKIILGHLSGKMRINYIRVLPGDRVKCEMNSLDLTRGRIVAKLPKL